MLFFPFTIGISESNGDAVTELSLDIDLNDQAVISTYNEGKGMPFTQLVRTSKAALAGLVMALQGSKDNFSSCSVAIDKTRLMAYKYAQGMYAIVGNNGDSVEISEELLYTFVDEILLDQEL